MTKRINQEKTTVQASKQFHFLSLVTSNNYTGIFLKMKLTEFFKKLKEMIRRK